MVLPWLQKKKKTGSFGVTIEAARICCAINPLNKSDNIADITQGEVSLAGRQSFEKGMLRLRDEYDLNKFHSYWVLCGDQYQTLLIDRPNVSSREYRAAALWQIKDLIEYPVYDCVIDVFKPADEITTYKNKLYVIAAKKSFLTRITALLQNLNMPPAVITTQEFAIRNVLSKVESFSGKAIAVLTFDSTQYLLTIIKNQEIVFSRRILSNIIFELERSFEFFLSSLKQKKIDVLILKGVRDDSDFNRLSETIREEMTIINLDKEGISFNASQEEIKVPAFYALGGALEQLDAGVSVNAAN